ncbi:MAG: hypothetical protein WCP55_18600 [Lentisphaerota bacterium]
MEIKDAKYELHRRGDNNTIFEASHQDTAGDPQYFGYMNNEGVWIIQKFTAATGAWTYVSGRNDYATAWGLRASLSYGLYSAMFP